MLGGFGLDVRLALALGVGLLLFTTYYLEKKVSKEKIFWGFSGAGVFFGVLSVYAVASRQPNYDYLITLAVIAVLIAILYLEEEVKEVKKEE
jgi:4-amino-4-deoxy-L-arabinose transferase-like glycosyltransferase